MQYHKSNAGYIFSLGHPERTRAPNHPLSSEILLIVTHIAVHVRLCDLSEHRILLLLGLAGLALWFLVEALLEASRGDAHTSFRRFQWLLVVNRMRWLTGCYLVEDFTGVAVSIVPDATESAHLRRRQNGDETRLEIGAPEIFSVTRHFAMEAQ